MLEVHPNLALDDLKVGMRVRKSYKSAFERQIGEAISIHQDKLNGYTLMNSKSQFNRCVVPRISMNNENEKLKKLKEELEKENERKKQVRLLRKRKKYEKDLGKVCGNIITQCKGEWEARQEAEKEKRKELYESEASEWEKFVRLNKAKKKKEDFLK